MVPLSLLDLESKNCGRKRKLGNGNEGGLLEDGGWRLAVEHEVVVEPNGFVKCRLGFYLLGHKGNIYNFILSL